MPRLPPPFLHMEKSVLLCLVAIATTDKLMSEMAFTALGFDSDEPSQEAWRHLIHTISASAWARDCSTPYELRAAIAAALSE
jgi:hypothetical protein